MASRRTPGCVCTSGPGVASCESRRPVRLPFERTGDVIVPEALAPVHCETEHDHAVYVEPNIWVEHDLTAP
jgi:hypothetical protein